MTEDDVKASMSIAGNPEKITSIMSAMGKEMDKLDRTNAAELNNMLFALDRLKAEVKLYLKWLEDKTGQKY